MPRGFPDIRMKVKVTQDNFAVRGLEISSFTVFEDGMIQIPIAGYCEDTLQQLPVSVLLVMDVSGSMRGGGLVNAQRAAKDFIDRLAPSDEAALLSFSTTPSFDQPWTQNKTLMKTSIDALSAGGRTALYDAVWMGSNLITPRENKKVMIVLADGDDGASSNSFYSRRKPRCRVRSHSIYDRPGRYQ